MPAFSGMPKLENPLFARYKTAPVRNAHIQSHSDSRPQKVECSTQGEIETMREVDSSNFLWQALIGPGFAAFDLHVVSRKCRRSQKAWGNWQASVWNKLKNDPQY